MKTKFNIPKLMQAAFGVKGFALDVAINNQQPNKKPTALYSGFDIIPAPTAPSIQSYLGTPIYEQITLTVPILDAKTQKQTTTYDYTFPDWPMFDITAGWIVKTSQTTGGMGGNSYPGTIKEFIGQDDFKITIRGLLINHGSQDYPSQLVSDLWKVLNAQKALGIRSNVFNLLNIHSIVVLDARFPSLEGYMNVQPFEIDCLSDIPLILQIKSVATGKPVNPANTNTAP